MFKETLSILDIVKIKIKLEDDKILVLLFIVYLSESSIILDFPT